MARTPISISRREHLGGLGGAAALALSAAPGGHGLAEAAGAPGHDPVVITEWDATMDDTIITDAATVTAEAFHWYALTQAAVYNAVVGITGRYELYKWTVRSESTASPHGIDPSSRTHVGYAAVTQGTARRAVWAASKAVGLA